MMLLEVDPNLVRPGWTPLVVIVLLGVVLFFLGRSMIKQFGRIDVPGADDVDPDPTGPPTGTGAPTAPLDGSDAWSRSPSRMPRAVAECHPLAPGRWPTRWPTRHTSTSSVSWPSRPSGPMPRPRSRAWPRSRPAYGLITPTRRGCPLG